MANEAELLTINEAGDSWVDSSPGNENTGYKAQNTNIEAARNGFDGSNVRWDSGTDEVVVDPSGPVDENGDLIKITTEVRFSIPSANTYYIRIVPGTLSNERSLELVTDGGTWDADKNAFYDGSSRRILNWIIIASSTTEAVVFNRKRDSSFENSIYCPDIVMRIDSGDSNIQFAGDANMLFDESDDQFEFDKKISSSAVRTASITVDSSIICNGFYLPRLNPTENSQSIGSASNYVFPRGAYLVAEHADLQLQVETSSSWRDIYPLGSGGLIFSDGLNVRALNTNGGSITIYYRTF